MDFIFNIFSKYLILLTPITILLVACAQEEKKPTSESELRKLVAECESNSDAELPDLIVVDIFKKEGIPFYYYVSYMNVAAASEQGDFLISLSANDNSYPGNSFYRFPVPPPCSVMETGGISVSLVGVAETEAAEITAEIDWEQRVAEASEENNLYVKTVPAH